MNVCGLKIEEALSLDCSKIVQLSGYLYVLSDLKFSFRWVRKVIGHMKPSQVNWRLATARNIVGNAETDAGDLPRF